MFGSGVVVAGVWVGVSASWAGGVSFGVVGVASHGVWGGVFVGKFFHGWSW